MSQPDVLLDRNDIARILKVCRATTYVWEREGILPKPVSFGVGVQPRKRWRKSDIDRLIANPEQEAA